MTDEIKKTINTDIEAAAHIRAVSEKLAVHAAQMGHTQLAHLLRLASMEADGFLKSRSKEDDKK